MNAPLAQEHLTPELHEALGRVTLDVNMARSDMFQRSYELTGGEAGGFVVERGGR